MSDLLEVADAVVGLARGDEQLEAYVARSTDTSVRVYRGEVEQLSVADTLGVGVRVVAGGRQGFAYCGTFETIAKAPIRSPRCAGPPVQPEAITSAFPGT